VKPLEEAQTLVPSALNMAAWSMLPVPTRLVHGSAEKAKDQKAVRCTWYRRMLWRVESVRVECVGGVGRY